MNSPMTEKQMFPLSSELKEAIGKYATEHNISVAELIRSSVANTINFKYTQTDSRKKYANAEERKEAQKQRQKKDREDLKKFRELQNQK